MRTIRYFNRAIFILFIFGVMAIRLRLIDSPRKVELLCFTTDSAYPSQLRRTPNTVTSVLYRANASQNFANGPMRI